MNEKNCCFVNTDVTTWIAYTMEDPLDNTHYIPDELLDEHRKAWASVDESVRKMLEFVEALGQKKIGNE